MILVVFCWVHCFQIKILYVVKFLSDFQYFVCIEVLSKVTVIVNYVLFICNKNRLHQACGDLLHEINCHSNLNGRVIDMQTRETTVKRKSNFELHFIAVYTLPLHFRKVDAIENII